MQYYKLNKDFCENHNSALNKFIKRYIGESVFTFNKDEKDRVRTFYINGIEMAIIFANDIKYRAVRANEVNSQNFLSLFSENEINNLIKLKQSSSNKIEKFYTIEGCFDLVVRTKEFIIGTDSLGKERVFALEKELTIDDAMNSVLCDLDYYSDIPLVNQLQEKGFKIVPIN